MGRLVGHQVIHLDRSSQGLTSVWSVWCLTVCHPMDYNLPGSSVHGIL